MSRKRRLFTAKFKSKVAREALTERYTLLELAEKYEIHPNQISNWKRDLVDGSERIFETRRGRKSTDQQEFIDRLYRQIGQLQVELDWLKTPKGWLCQKIWTITQRRREARSAGILRSV